MSHRQWIYGQCWLTFSTLLSLLPFQFHHVERAVLLGTVDFQHLRAHIGLKPIAGPAQPDPTRPIANLYLKIFKLLNFEFRRISSPHMNSSKSKLWANDAPSYVCIKSCFTFLTSLHTRSQLSIQYFSYSLFFYLYFTFDIG